MAHERQRACAGRRCAPAEVGIAIGGERDVGRGIDRAKCELGRDYAVYGAGNDARDGCYSVGGDDWLCDWSECEDGYFSV